MRLLPKVKQAELIRLRRARTRKEDINQGFESLITELRNEGATNTNNRRELETFGTYSEQEYGSSSSTKVDTLKTKHKNEVESQQKRHAIEKEKLKASMARAKQAEILR